MKKPYNGNKIQGYSLGCWNCGRGLIDGSKFATTKLIEAREFIKQKKLYILYLTRLITMRSKPIILSLF